MKSLSVVLLLICISAISSFGCECGPPGHASVYVKEASLVFVGKVVFTDDDGSGKFTQRTLVHFEVEELFKGLKSDVRDVWIDPGSCTSCYAEYKVGERFLVFAYGGSLLPKDTSAMSAASNGCKVKPFPAAFDSKNPPKVYFAPECSGTRQIVRETESSMAREVDWLRKYKEKAEKVAN
jgi:hypothetical protein